jgi:hypothetical protein
VVVNAAYAVVGVAPVLQVMVALLKGTVIEMYKQMLYILGILLVLVAMQKTRGETFI